MELFSFVSWTLVTIVAVTLIWPINIPLMALAYKVRHGPRPIPMEGQEFWVRCTLAAVGLAGLSLVLLGLLYVLVGVLPMPGPVQLTLLLVYLPAAVGFLFWVLALEDLLQALSVFLLYILLPGLLLLLIGRVAGLWETLQQKAPWLLLPST